MTDRLKRETELPVGYQFGEARGLHCFSSDCAREITGEVVWLGETYEGVEHEWPFHPRCAEGPWPLYEIRRSHTIGWNVIEADHHPLDEQ